ncbi:MAG TPA: DUF6428 family protein, partial [Opitutaceae bacterium]|nr:DUF6428 family protein [Opitutaceae bacterium]
MHTSAFPDTLRARRDHALVFRAGSRLIHPGYHLTEVKRVAYETMDCGGLAHRWNETHPCRRRPVCRPPHDSPL